MADKWLTYTKGQFKWVKTADVKKTRKNRFWELGAKKKAKKKYYPDLKPIMNGELEKLLKYFKL